MNFTKHLLLAASLLLLVGGSAVAATAGSAAPSPFHLVFEGRHEPAADSPRGFWHVGPFTASDGFCSSGNGTTLGVTGTTSADATATRLLTCEDGSGSATALVVPSDSEHGGVGEWRIVSGTGQHAKLRGQGTFASDRTGGNPLDHGSITFRSRWTGVTDLDDVGPVIDISKATAARLGRPTGSYLVRVAFSARDTPGGTVQYRIVVRGGDFLLNWRTGQTASGMASVTLRVRPPKKVRKLRLEVSASDPVGNERTLVQSLRLPR